MAKDEAWHERLSNALCEAEEFGVPTQIKLGFEDRVALLASLSHALSHKLDVKIERFENVPITVERDRKGCVVEHDGRYTFPAASGPARAIPESAAVDRRTRKPVIVAW